jgi:hypothetical protein
MCSTPAVPVPVCLSTLFAPLISRSRVLSLALALLPRYSVSCRVLEYSWRLPLPNRGNLENIDGSLLPGLSVFVFLTALNGRRKRRVARYVVTRMVKTATTIMAICTSCQNKRPWEKTSCAGHTTTKLFACLSILLSRAGALASNVGSRIVEHQISLCR